MLGLVLLNMEKEKNKKKVGKLERAIKLEIYPKKKFFLVK